MHRITARVLIAFLLVESLAYWHTENSAMGQSGCSTIQCTLVASDVARVSAENDNPELPLPSVVAVARIVDYPQFKKLIEQHFIGRIMSDDAFQPFRQELANAGIVSPLKWEMQDWNPVGAFTDLAQHDVVMLFTQKTAQEPAFTVVIETPTTPSSVAQTISNILDSAIAKGAVKEEPQVGENWQIQRLHHHQRVISVGWTLHEESTETPAVLSGTSKETGVSQPTIVCISSCPEMANRILTGFDSVLEKWREQHSNKEQSDSAAETTQSASTQFLPSLPQLLVESITRIRLPEPARPGEVCWHWNPQRMPKRDLEHPSGSHSQIQPQAEKGYRDWEGIQSFCGRISLSTDSPTINGELLIEMKGARNQGMFSLFTDTGNGDLPNLIVTNDLCQSAVMSWNIPKVIERLGELYDRFTETPGAFDQTLAATEEELGVNLEKGLFSVLGPAVRLISLSNDTTQQDSVFVLDIQQPDLNAHRISEILQRLFAEDTESQKQEIEGHRYPLWRINLGFDAQEKNATQSGVMVVGEQLWCSMNANALLDSLRAEGDDRSADISPLIQGRLQLLWQFPENHISQLKPATNLEATKTNPALIAFIDCEKLLAPAYRLLKYEGRQGKSDSSDLASEWLAALLDSNDRFGKVDFATLPDFTHWSSQLGKFLMVLMPHAEGWQVNFSQHLDLSVSDSMPNSRK